MTALPIGPGRLIGVVGPSGSGKDTLLRGARRHFENNPEIVFPKRAITRPTGDASEDHTALTRDAFDQLCAEGAFALAWNAHGLRYGIPALIDGEIAQDRTVVVNLSRSVIKEVRARYANSLIVAISIDTETMRRRLFARGRESRENIEQRLARMDDSPPEKCDVVIDNSGSLSASTTRFHSAIAEMVSTSADDL